MDQHIWKIDTVYLRNECSSFDAIRDLEDPVIDLSTEADDGPVDRGYYLRQLLGGVRTGARHADGQVTAG
jgi:hypothetical protein